MIKAVSIVLALTLGGGLTFAKGDAPALTEQDKADVQKWLALFDKFVDAVVADKDDCGKMATDINALVDANKELIERASKAIAAGKKLPEDARKHMQASGNKMGAAMQKCGSDKGVKAAMQRMSGKPAK